MAAGPPIITGEKGQAQSKGPSIRQAAVARASNYGKGLREGSRAEERLDRLQARARPNIKGEQFGQGVQNYRNKAETPYGGPS